MNGNWRFARTSDDGNDQNVTDLHTLTIRDSTMYPDSLRPLWDCRTPGTSEGAPQVLFHDLENALIAFLAGAELVVGCVAWLTSGPILDALAALPGVALLVQKEDFLRPDFGAAAGWKNHLRARYAALHEGPSRLNYLGILGGASTSLDDIVAPVRCLGNYNRAKSPAFPRMHHKFAVRCHTESFYALLDPTDPSDKVYLVETVVPDAVWTGSYNWTKNAGRSFENALILRDDASVDAYFDEWQQLMLLSESLDWETDWVDPEWRLGT